MSELVVKLVWFVKIEWKDLVCVDLYFYLYLLLLLIVLFCNFVVFLTN